MRRFCLLFAFGMTVATAGPAGAQATSPSGRISFTAQSFTASEAGQSLPSFTEMVVAATFASPGGGVGGNEFRVDFRASGTPGSDTRPGRFSVYDAYVGRQFGALGMRVGQMWINDLGGLGSVGGGMVEYRRSDVLGFRRLRAGGFGGFEPRIMSPGYVQDVMKAGGFLTLEGRGAWRNTVGLVTVRNTGIVERTVLTTTNFLPFGNRFLVYQAAEFDLAGIAADHGGRLTYFFVNGRYAPTARFEFQGVYHRGRSLDVRGITLDQLAGRPVSSRTLEGLLYESAGGRLNVAVTPQVRLFAGYTRDRNNREDRATGRTTFGAFATNLFHTGVDVNVSDARMSGPMSTYDSWDALVGRSLGTRMYLSFEYATWLSAFRAISQDAFQIETRPRTNRYSLSDLIRLGRRVSLLASLDRTEDGFLRELRWMTTLVYRF
ncbi:MAG: hypothetical protein ACM3NQ_10825 [Bacteroidales bacterium]